MDYQRLFLQVRPNSCVDIGAHVGDFSSIVKRNFPKCNIIMVEANPFCEEQLKNLNIGYEMLGLSSQRGSAELFIENSNKVGTGASLYRENTDWYTDEKMEKVTVELDTLDNRNYFPNELIDLVKMDVQGSELDILLGGRKTIRRSKYVLMEVSLVQYNIGAPLMDVIVEKMKEYEFRIEDILNYDKLSNGQIFQMDILFKNTYV
jgi:FkbM family methyltransferase